MSLNKKEFAEKLEIINGIDAPCSDISFKWDSSENAMLAITLHFSRVIGGFSNDVMLEFKEPVALQWEDEMFDHIPFPNRLPNCIQEKFSDYSYPVIVVQNSKWAELYNNSIHSSDEPGSIYHFGFISLDDTLCVLTKDQPKVKIIAQ